MLPINWLGRGWQLGLSSSLALVIVSTGGAGNLAIAQVTADRSLGTTVTPNGTTLEITGGTSVSGTNLFHSFTSFSVQSGEIADFRNATTINNILVRVTGGTRSDIQGQLRAQGSANLFLINPNGILFGSGARLSIGGSFVGTTANAIGFPGGGEFSMTSQVEPQNSLLAVNPSALLFNQISAQPITNQSTRTGLRVPTGRSLLLVGGNVNLEGGRLEAEGGRVELGGVAGAGTVGLGVDGNNLRLSFPNDVVQADVSLSNGASISASAPAGGGGGNIQVQGRRVTLTNGSGISVNTLGSQRGGTLAVTASESVELTGGSRLLTQTQSTGAAGDIRIDTKRLIVRDGAQVSASTRSEGQGGTLVVTASESVEVSGTSGFGTPSGLFAIATQEATGAAGDLRLETGQLTVRDGAVVSASTLNQKNGGNINLQVQDLLLLRRNGEISTSAGTRGAGGDGGNINIDAKLIVAVPFEDSNIIANAFEGNGGNINITTQGIFGIQFREERRRLNDIDASSEFGVNGIVQINTPEVDPSRGLTNLATDVVDASNQIAQNCAAGGTVASKQSSFVVTGRGGLPSSPHEMLSIDAVWSDFRTSLVTRRSKDSEPVAARAVTPQLATRNPQPAIVEAQGWVINDKGQVVLTATVPTVTPHSSGLSPVVCRRS